MTGIFKFLLQFKEPETGNCSGEIWIWFRKKVDSDSVKGLGLIPKDVQVNV